MMLRRQFVRKHVDGSEIDHVIGHHWSMFFPVFARLFLYLLGAYIVYMIFSRVSPGVNLTRIFVVIGLFVYARAMISFLNYYLDSIALTERGVVVFKWE